MGLLNQQPPRESLPVRKTEVVTSVRWWQNYPRVAEFRPPDIELILRYLFLRVETFLTDRCGPFSSTRLNDISTRHLTPAILLICRSGLLRNICRSGFLYTICKAGLLRNIGRSGFLRTICKSGLFGTICRSGFLRTICKADLLRTSRWSGLLRTVCKSGLCIVIV